MLEIPLVSRIDANLTMLLLRRRLHIDGLRFATRLPDEFPAAMLVFSFMNLPWMMSSDKAFSVDIRNDQMSRTCP